MEEFYTFISEQYILPFYLIVWVVSMAKYSTYFDTPLKFYPVYLMYTFLNELLGYFIKYFDEFQVVDIEQYRQYNVIIFNIYSVISFLFLYYIYWRMVQTKKHKKWIQIGATISLLSYAISLFFQSALYSNLYYADMIASFVLFLNVWLYLKEKKSDPNPYPNKHNLMYWLSLGLIIFYSIFPILFWVGYEAPKIWVNYHFRTILRILILILYGSFLVGVLVHKRRAFR
jgi:small-conductance mechanosensitive channel